MKKIWPFSALCIDIMLKGKKEALFLSYENEY